MADIGDGAVALLLQLLSPSGAPRFQFIKSILLLFHISGQEGITIAGHLLGYQVV
jgi:hypothetical protein